MVMVSSSHKARSQGTTPAPTSFRADAVPVPTSFRTVATCTSSQWVSASVPTSWILFCLCLGPLCCWGGWPVAAWAACCLLAVLHLRFQCPILPHAPHLASLAGQEACPGHAVRYSFHMSVVVAAVVAVVVVCGGPWEVLSLGVPSGSR